MGLDIYFTHHKSGKELYYRKVPRIVMATCYYLAKNKGLNAETTFEKANSLSKDNQWMRYGSTSFELVEEAFQQATSNKKFYGYQGFFWGEDSWWTNEKILEAYNTWKKSIKNLRKNSRINYCFSW